MNIYKIVINGTEYQIKDKDAQLVIEALKERVAELEKHSGKLCLIDID
ncbi:MAG: hypothetical protein NC131_10440 [Roseburia sp.]|nr:hypothetical protein [Roseburia sp.]